MFTDLNSTGSFYLKCMRLDNTQTTPTGITEIMVVSNMAAYEARYVNRVAHNKSKKYYFWIDCGRKIGEGRLGKRLDTY